MRAVGAVVPTTFSVSVFKVPPTALTDRVLPLQELWTHEAVEKLLRFLKGSEILCCVRILHDEIVTRLQASSCVEPVWDEVQRVIGLQEGRVSIRQLAKECGLSRQDFARRFAKASGFLPKRYARVTRFHRLVRTLLATDVSGWVGVASDAGFYDQAHMINEFRAFAGSPPRVFFRPHDDVDPAIVQVRGRPREWLLGNQ